MKTALVIIDMLNDFIRPGRSLYVPGAEAIVPVIRELAAAVRARGLPVIQLTDAHAPDDPEFAGWPAHAVRGTVGAQIVAELSPAPEDLVIPKTFIDTFREPAFPAALQDLGVERLLLAGVASEYCVLSTALGALRRGIEVLVVGDAIRAVERKPGDGARAVAEMAAAGAIFVTAREAVSRLD
jgi:nicotinamidase-related amidase